MNDKEKDYKKLNRAELLELLIAQIKENEALVKADRLQKKETQELNNKLRYVTNKLKNRDIIIENSGSIAEASLQINDVFISAQNAAQQYIDNVERKYSQKEALCREAINKAEEDAALIRQEARENAEQIRQEALENAEKIELQAHQKSSSIIAEAELECAKKKVEIDQYWGELSKRLESFYQSHKGLKDLMRTEAD